MTPLVTAIADARRRIESGGGTVVVVAGPGTAGLPPATCRCGPGRGAIADTGLTSEPCRDDVVTVTCGHLEDSIVLSSAGLAVTTEADLTGNRGGALDAATRLPGRRRNTIDPARQPGDHEAHFHQGIGRYLPMVQRTTGGAVHDYLVVQYAQASMADRRSSVRAHLRAGPTVPAGRGRDACAEQARPGGLGRDQGQGAQGRSPPNWCSCTPRGHRCPATPLGPDAPWRAETEDPFPSLEAPDQASAIDEVLADMQRPVSMDRIVAGDVG